MQTGYGALNVHPLLRELYKDNLVTETLGWNTQLPCHCCCTAQHDHRNNYRSSLHVRMLQPSTIFFSVSSFPFPSGDNVMQWRRQRGPHLNDHPVCLTDRLLGWKQQSKLLLRDCRGSDKVISLTQYGVQLQDITNAVGFIVRQAEQKALSCIAWL